jgi:hypothetical protein
MLERRLFNTLKRRPNLETIKELIEQDVDCNLSYFDRRTRTFISPIQLAAKSDRHIALPYLYEHRNSPTKEQLDQHLSFYINHHNRSQPEKNEILFDYTISRLLYTRINAEHTKQIFDTLIVSLHGFDKAEYRKQSLTDGSRLEIFLQLRIYSLFRKMIDMKINSDTNMIDIIEKEFLHNLETYYFLVSVESISLVTTEGIIKRISSETGSQKSLLQKCYESIAKNVINKIEQLQIKEEYTIPTGWFEHAVCVSFRRISQTHIVIRIDNPASGNPSNMHEIEHSVDDHIRIKPRVLGQLHVDKLEGNLIYFISLIDSVRRDLTPKRGRSLIYNLKGQIHHLEEIQIENFPSFDEQADENCVVKCFEPGMQIRFGLKHPSLYQSLLLYERNTANLLTHRSEEEHQRNLIELLYRFISLAKEEDMVNLPNTERTRLQDKLKVTNNLINIC